jgi:hypothetical protein
MLPTGGVPGGLTFTAGLPSAARAPCAAIALNLKLLA